MDSIHCIAIFLVLAPCFEAIYVISPGLYYNAYDVANPAAASNPAGNPNRISMVSGTASFAQNADPLAQMPSMGGPYDLDPADYPSASSPFANPGAVSGNPAASGTPAGFDISMPNLPKGFNLPPIRSPLSNTASGTVINSGHATVGGLNAAGQSNTQTGPLGSQVTGTGSLSGHGLGISGTQVNSGDAGTANIPGSPFPGGASSNNMFVNSMSADKGKISGNSRTLSNTGPNGNAFGSSSGSAMGRGDGVELSQVANSNSQGTSNFQPAPFPM